MMYGLIGYIFGENWQYVSRLIDSASYVIVLIAVVLILSLWLVKRRIFNKIFPIDGKEFRTMK